MDVLVFSLCDMRFAQTPSAARVHEVSVQLGGVNSNTLDKADWK